jgi:hypothetical protein
LRALNVLFAVYQRHCISENFLGCKKNRFFYNYFCIGSIVRYPIYKKRRANSLKPHISKPETIKARAEIKTPLVNDFIVDLIDGDINFQAADFCESALSSRNSFGISNSRSSNSDQ